MGDRFSDGVKEVLAHRAGYRCSKPDCRASTAGPSRESPTSRSNVGVAAHITAASEQPRRRYDPSLSSEERRSAANGIWLCQTHAKAIDDDQETFPTYVLRAWKEHAETTARALLGRPIGGHLIEAAVEVSLQRGTNDELVAVGTTNLPSGTKVWVQLFPARSGRQLGTAKTSVFRRFFAAEGFTRAGEPHPQDWYGVEVLAYFNGPWQQPNAVIEIVGKDGASLVGPHADLVDPDVEDSDTRLSARFECVAPPLKAATVLTASELEHAVDVLRSSTIVTPGRDPSSGTVEETVRYFMGSPGLREHEGWKSREVAPGLVEVAFSYFDGERPASAIWHVIPAAGSVRYRNKYAKWMSWLAAD